MLHSARSLAFVLIAGFCLNSEVCHANPYGTLIAVPTLNIPGAPLTELTVNGETYLLLRGESAAGDIEARLWNPNELITIEIAPPVTVNIISGLAGMQTAQGPRVFLSGDFEIGGTGSRLIEWNGVDWSLPGGAVTGVIPSDLAVRLTTTGPELWTVGNFSLFPGIATQSPVGVYDGVSWQTPGTVVGSIDEILVVREDANLDDTVVIAGDLASVAGLPVSGVASFNGNWDSLNGGFSGTRSSMSAFADEQGALEIWVVGTPGPSAIWPVSRFSNGAWEDLPLPFLSSGSPPGGVSRLPTILGEWRIFENLGRLQPGPTVEIALQPVAGIAWNPTTGLYRPTSTPSLGVIDFESPSGLTPVGSFSISNTGEVSVWTVELIEFTRGDANFDGLINIADPIAVLRDSFGGEPLDCRTAGDINGDASTNIADAINLLSYLFEQSFTIQAPFPDCAFEPSVIRYDCQTIPDCP